MNLKRMGESDAQEEHRNHHAERHKNSLQAVHCQNGHASNSLERAAGNRFLEQPSSNQMSRPLLLLRDHGRNFWKAEIEKFEVVTRAVR